MKIVSTKAAFAAILEEKNVSKKLGVSRSTVSNWKAYLEQGNSLTVDKMEEMLTKYGATVIAEKVWEIETTNS